MQPAKQKSAKEQGKPKGKKSQKRPSPPASLRSSSEPAADNRQGANQYSDEATPSEEASGSNTMKKDTG